MNTPPITLPPLSPAMARVLVFVRQHPDIVIRPILAAGPTCSEAGGLLCAGHASTHEGYPFSDLSGGLTSIQRARDWLGY